MFKWFFSGLLVLLTCLCQAQSLDLKFDHLTSENGLPQNGTFGIAKDKYGFMWFGTWSGLCRYDGYRFKIYRSDPAQPRSLINSRIMSLEEDTENNLWIQTANDSIICKYNYQTDDFERIPIKKVPHALMKNLKWDGRNSRLSVTGRNYLWKIDSKTDRLSQTYLPTGSEKQYISNPIDRWSLNDAYVTDIYLDDQNVFWVGTYSDGINKANLDAKPFHSFYHIPNDRNTIIDNHVRTITGDLKGNLWVGTRAKGITIISPDKSYRHLNSEPGNKIHISHDHIKMLYCNSGGTVWIGMLKGLNSYNPVNGQLKRHENLGLKDAAIFGAMEDHAHQMWFATWSGIYQYIPKSDSLIHFNTGQDLKSHKAMAIIEDRYQKIWVGTEGGGISVFTNPGNGKLKLVKQFTNAVHANTSLSDNRIYSMYEDAAGYIWIGTGNGVDRYDPVQQSFKHLSASPNGLTSGTIAAITGDNNGFVWVSHKKGISQIDRKSLSVRNYSTQDGLQSSEFSDGAAYNDRKTGMLYFGGNNGYNVFHPDSIKVDHSLPRVVLTELQILNKPVMVNDTVNGRILLTHPLYLTDHIQLGYKDKSIAIEFAGMHYANPSGNKYAYMLEGFDKEWIYTDASNRIATYSNLARGSYTFKVKASNSDGIWNPVPVTLQIIVMPPWWSSTAAYIIYAILLVVVLYTVFYYSLRYDRLKMSLNYESIFNQKELELRQNKIEFFTNISHEIKTPLSLILAPIERLMMNSDDKGFIATQLNTMKKNGDRLLRLINQLLDIRRLEAGHELLNIEQGNLDNFVERVLASFLQLAAERNISLSYHSLGAEFHIAFDHDKLEKVLYNLLSNAFKFAAPGGKIVASLTQVTADAKAWAVIEIADDGVVIPEDEFERIFKPFQQASTNKTGGTGLGLAYSKALVELHGGNISVKSGRDNSGRINTVFTVSLPMPALNSIPNTQTFLPVTYNGTDISDEHSEDNSGGSSNEMKQHNSKLPLLLLVEDNAELRTYLKHYFQSDYQIYEASNGYEGLVIAQERSPDIIISDMMMPQMDGLELCKKLKKEILTSHIPVILLTARSTVEYQLAGIETGADDYITKPFNLKLLSLKIKNLLAVRETLREKYKKKLSIQSTADEPISPDEKLLKKVLDFVNARMEDPELGIDHICDQIGLSKTQLYRKMTALTGMSTVELIKNIRLQRAGDLLKNKKFNVNEVSFMVGFTDTDYFRKCFKAHFGLSPSEFTRKALSAQETG